MGFLLSNIHAHCFNTVVCNVIKLHVTTRASEIDNARLFDTNYRIKMYAADLCYKQANKFSECAITCQCKKFQSELFKVKGILSKGK